MMNMGNIYVIAIIFVALSMVQSSHIPSGLYSKRQSKFTGRDSRKSSSPGEFLNINMKSSQVISVRAGGNFELECEAVGSPPPSVKWYNNENLILETGFPEENDVVYTALGKVRSRIIVDCVMPHHQGIYTCSGVSGTKRKVSSPATILIEGNSDFANLSCDRNIPRAPRIVTWTPTLLEVSEKDIILPCLAVGNPRPEIYWINNRNQLIDSASISSRYKILENGNLIITKINWDDMGQYTCIAQNSLGEDKAESFVYPMKS